MFFVDRHERSLAPKLFVLTALLAGLGVAGWMLFGPLEALPAYLKPPNSDAAFARRLVLMICFGVYVARLLATLFVFYRRKMYWIEAILVANLMPVVFPFGAYLCAGIAEPLGWPAAIGFALYGLGSTLNTVGEYRRDVWKRDHRNAGQLYTGGLFRRVRHVNYLGDVLIFSGIALIVGDLRFFIVPGLMVGLFAGFLIPLKEQYLREKYGVAFDAYAARSQRLIPFLF